MAIARAIAAQITSFFMLNVINKSGAGNFSGFDT